MPQRRRPSSRYQLDQGTGRRRTQHTDEPPPKEDNTALILLGVGGVALLGGIILVIILVVQSGGDDDGAARQQNNNVVRNDPAPRQNPRPIQPRVNPRQDDSAPNSNTPRPFPRQRDDRTQTNRIDPNASGFQDADDLKPKIPSGTGFNTGSSGRTNRWEVKIAKAIPTDGEVESPDKENPEGDDKPRKRRKMRLQVDVPVSSLTVVYPENGSNFVALCRSARGNEIQTVYDLQTHREVGEFGVNGAWLRDPALSPDGSLFAAYAARNDVIGVWDVKEEKVLGQLKIERDPDKLMFPSPERLLAITWDKVLLWEMPGGKPLPAPELPSFKSNESLTVSPDGRYLTVAKSNEGTVTLIDLTSGTTAGVTEGVPLESGQGLKGLTFSPDGTLLAGYYEGFNDQRTIAIWDMEDGSLADAFDVEQNPLKVGNLSFRYGGRPLEWFPGNRRLLLQGHALIDRDAAAMIWHLGAPNGRVGTVPARRPVSESLVAYANADGRGSSLQLGEISEEQIAKAAETVRSGGTAADTNLPPLTKADWSGARKIALGANVAWNVAAESSAGDAAGEDLLKRPIVIDAGGMQVGTARLSDVHSARALVMSVRGKTRVRNRRSSNSKSNSPAVLLDLYDLKSSRKLKTVSISFNCELLALSPSGKLAVMRLAPGGDRLDVWNAETGDHVCAFRPHLDDGTEAGKHANDQPRKIEAAAFVDDGHLLTINQQGKLVLWEIPKCRAIYAIGGMKAPALSNSSKYIASFNGKNIELFDSLTAEPLGNLETPGTALASCFSHDGHAFAACVQTSSGSRLVVWNLATGEVTSEGPLPYGVNSLHFVGNDYILIDGKTLVHRKYGVPVWTYDLFGGRHIPQSPDGRHWYLAEGTRNKTQVSLVRVSLPEPDIAESLSATKLDELLIIRPGVTVSVRVECSVPGQPGLTSEVRTHIEQEFERMGIHVSPGQPIEFVVTASEESTGETHDYRSFGFSSRGDFSISGKKITMAMRALVNNQEVWKRESSSGNGLFHISTKDDPQTYADNAMRSGAAARLKNYVPPKYVLPGSFQYGFGRSRLTAAGPVKSQ